MDVQVHFIREIVWDVLIAEKYVPSVDNDADLLNKRLGKQQHETIWERIVIESPAEE